MGTAAYLSPEQITHSTADARSDVYACGIMLYELLTGRQPHTGDSPIAVAYQHVNEDVPRPSRVVPGIPRKWTRWWCAPRNATPPTGSPTPASSLPRSSPRRKRWTSSRPPR